jgi:hypothetical protein
MMPENVKKNTSMWRGEMRVKEKRLQTHSKVWQCTFEDEFQKWRSGTSLTPAWCAWNHCCNLQLSPELFQHGPKPCTLQKSPQVDIHTYYTTTNIKNHVFLIIIFDLSHQLARDKIFLKWSSVSKNISSSRILQLKYSKPHDVRGKFPA